MRKCGNHFCGNAETIFAEMRKCGMRKCGKRKFPPHQIFKKYKFFIRGGGEGVLENYGLFKFIFCMLAGAHIIIIIYYYYVHTYYYLFCMGIPFVILYIFFLSCAVGFTG